MLKKTLAIVLTIAMLASMWVMPTSARTLNNYKIFSVDFSTGSANDIAGGLTGTITSGKTLTYKTDSTIGRQVAEFDGTTALFYNIPLETYLGLIQNFSVEALVKVSNNAPWGWAQICGTYNYDSSGNGNDSGFALGTGGPWNSILGTGNAFSLTQGTTAGTDSTFGCGSYNTWSHLVYVHTTSTEALYLNGQLVSSRNVLQGDIPHDTSKGIRIGGYNLAQQFCAGMDIAYVNMYNTNVTTAEIGELYSAAFPSAATAAPTVAPTTAPTATPSASTDVIPSQYHFFGVDFSSGSADDTVGGLAGAITTDKTITYANDSTIGRQVAKFDGATAVQYEFPTANYLSLTQNFTMETYVKVANSAPWGWAQILGTYYYNNNSGIALGTNGPWNGVLGTGNAFSISQGNATSSTSTLGCGSYNTWSHVVYVHTDTTESIYIDGQLVASGAAYQAQIPHDTSLGFRIGGYNLAQQFCGSMDIALVNLYSKAATASEVAGLYSAATGSGSVVTPTAAPTAAPTAVPTQKPTTPTPTPSADTVTVPTGSDYTISASEVGPFKAGDEVRVRLTVDKINNGWSLMGLDWIVPYNSDVLSLVEASCTSSSDIINANYPNGEVKWELILNTTKAGQVGVTMLDDGDGWMGTSENGALWVELVFTAKADSVDGTYLLHTSFADGTENVNLEIVKGTGVAVYAKGGAVVTPVPTQEPTTPPTEEPGIVIPTGDYYTLEASEVEPFKAGDEVRVRLTVSDIHDAWSLMGLDLTIPYNTDLLELVADSCTSSAADVNAADPNVAWELILNTNTVGKLLVTMLDDSDTWQGTSEDGALWVELVFTALADGNTGDYLLHTLYAEGTENVDLETAYGNGVAVYVAEGSEEPVVTPKPTEAPVITPTPEPTPVCTTPIPTEAPVVTPVPTPSIELPTGDFYSLSSNEIKPFKAGDEVRIRLIVSEIYDNWSLMGLDLTVPFNTDVLELVTSSCTSSSDIINADYPNGEVKWELILNTTKPGIIGVTMLDDGDGWMGTSEDGAIWVELVFTALADGNTGDYLLHTSIAEGTENVDLETAYGNGVAVYVAEGDEPVVTPKPTEEPTAEPVITPKPTEAPTPTATPEVTPGPTEDPGVQVTGVGIVAKPAKTFYKVGEELDLTGLIALIKYSDGTSVQVGPEGIEVDASAFDNTKAGKYLISIVKGGKIAQFTVHVSEPDPIVVTGVGLLAKPTKLYYQSGEELNLDGLVALVKYSDGTIKYVDQSGVTVDDSLFDNTTTGSYLISIVVDGKIAKFTVHVNVVSGVGIVTKPTKTTYAIGEELDLTGLVVMAKYADGSVKYKDKTTVEVDASAFDNTTAGTYLITVTVGGKSAQFSVHVQ